MRRWAQLPISALKRMHTVRIGLLRCRQRRRSWVLAVVLSDERPGDVYRIRGADNALNLGHVQNQSDSARLGERIKSLANIFVNRSQRLFQTLVESRLRVFTLALIVLFHLIDLVLLLLGDFWILDGCSFLQGGGGAFDLLLQPLQLSLSRLELCVDFFQGRNELRNSVFFVGKC